MYSQCPECQTRFRVTAEVLRTAHGTVRCGRCGSAFNALSRLTDTLHEQSLPPTLAGPATGLPPELVPDTSGKSHRHGNGSGHPGDTASETQFSEFHFSADDIERVFVDSRDWQRQFGAARNEVPGFETPAHEREQMPRRGAPPRDDTSADEPEVEVDETGSFEDFEDITLEGERVHIEGIPEHLRQVQASGPDDDEQSRRNSATDEHPLLDANMVEVELPEGAHSLLDPELLGTQADPTRGELLSLEDARLLESRTEAEPGGITSLLDAEWLEAELEEALHALETEPQADIESTDRFEAVKHVPDSPYPAYDDAGRPAATDALAEPATAAADPAVPRPPFDVRHVTPQDPALPDIVPVAAAGQAAAATVAATSSSSMPSVVTNAVAMPAPADAAGALSTGNRDEQRGRSAVGDLRPSARNWRTEPTATDQSPAAIVAAANASLGARSRMQAAALDDDAESLDDGTVKRNAGLWALGALLLGIVLAAQLTHYFRQDLLRDPNLGPALRRIYERVGVPLGPDWSLAAYELRQWGASDAAPVGGSMTVRASIKNRAAFAQPLPLLRLDLEDRFGGLVASRDFKPREYLKDPAQATRMLAANGVVEAQLALAETAPDAVGYKLDVCLSDGSRTVCAQADPR